jgi:8-oxo-dGTP pyrophosphatase MutT (NUDIX family)
MAKAYIIVHDATDVLVCQGGNSGKPPKARQGYHLPGGTAKLANLRQEALRELEEETGIKLTLADVTNDFAVNGVTFVVAKVPKVSALAFNPPMANNPNDQPFTSMVALPKNDWGNKNFDAAYYTDWFKDGLQHAYQNNMLI